MTTRKGDLQILCAQIVAGRGIREAAAAAGMSERTARRWRNEPEFAETLDRLSAAQSDVVSAELVALGGAAVETLAELMRPEVRADVRLRAATSVLSLGVQLRAQTWERRLVALENARVHVEVLAAQVSELFEVHE